MRTCGTGPTMARMILLVGGVLVVYALLLMLMIAMTRYLRDHPEDNLHDTGSWSDGLERRSDADPVVVDNPSPSPARAAATPSASDFDVPLDDMPAEVVAEVARRLRQQQD